MKNNKKLILITVALICVVAAMAGIYFATRPATEVGSKGFTVEVVHKDDSVKTFNYRTDGEYLGPVLVEKGLIVMDDVQSTMFSTVDGETAVWADDSGWWCLYENGEMAVVGINDVVINDGDSFKLEYTTDYVG